jgi:hypothetical protein
MRSLPSLHPEGARQELTQRNAAAAPGEEPHRLLDRAWPLPALFAWVVCWALYAALARGNGNAPAAALGAGVLGAGLALAGATPWRRIFIGCGFPLSLAVASVGAGDAMPAWAWLLPLVLLAFVYPLRAWRDAPIFPTPAGALRGLAQAVPLAPRAAILDAGSGLGAGLVELRREYPDSALEGIEWSWPLWLAGALRCRFARVRRGDLWSADWSSFALVYLFQRPESMARAAAKASHELAPGAWLASLEFEIATLLPQLVLESSDGRRVWLYRAPFRTLG